MKMTRISLCQSIAVHCSRASIGLTVLRLWRGTSSVVKCSMTIKTDPGIPAKKHKGQLHRYCHTQTNQYQYLSLERMRTYAIAIATHVFFIDSNFKSAVQVTSMGVERHRFQRNVSRSSRIPRFVLPKGLELPGSHGDQHSCWRRAKAAIWWSDYVFRIFGFWSGSNKTDRLHNLWAIMWYYVVL